MRTKSVFASTTGTLILAANLSAAAISVFNTGVCGGSNPSSGSTCSGGLLLTSPNQIDQNYKIIARSDGGATGSGTSETTMPIGGSPAWVAQNTTSDWITPVPGGNFAAPNTYTYQTAFSLSGFIPSTLVLSLSIAADNLVSVRINGGSTNVFTPACNSGPPASQPFCFQQFFSTTINDTQVQSANGAGWSGGTNTLEFLVTNNDNPSPTGLRVEISGNATIHTIPEPATFWLLGTGLAAAVLLAATRVNGAGRQEHERTRR